MARQQTYPTLEALRKLEASLCADARAHDEWESQLDDLISARQPRLQRSWRHFACLRFQSLLRSCSLLLRSCSLRRCGLIGGAAGGLALLAMGALWWRLSLGPIALDIATPWLTAAITENFGSGHEVEIGGTQLELDANGRPSLRIRDIVVRDADGTVVASAPKAEVGISGRSLFIGRIRAERLSLVGAEMAVRIELDSKLTVFAGSNKRPFVTASALSTPLMTGSAQPKASVPPPAVANPPAPSTSRTGVAEIAALLAWIESLDVDALDGRDLTEIGLKGGNLSVDDQRNGKQWSFTNRSERDATERRRHRREAGLGCRRTTLADTRSHDARPEWTSHH